MSAPGVSRIPPLRCAGVLVLFGVAGAGVQMLIQPSVTPPPAAAGSAAGAAPSSGNTAARATMPTRESLAALSPEEQIITLAAALPQMEIADLIPLVEHLLKARVVVPDLPPFDLYGNPTPDPISPLLRALFTRWAALDAAGLMAYVESGPLRYDYDTRRLAVLALVEVRGLSALEEVRAKSPSLAREAAREMLIRQPEQLEALLPFLIDSDRDRQNHGRNGMADQQLSKALGPARTLRYAAGTGNRSLLHAALTDLVNSGLERAVEVIKALPPSSLRESALAEVLDVARQFEVALTHGKCPDFLREYEALPDGKAKQLLTGKYAALRAQENPAAALKWAQGLSDARLRLEALATLSSSLFTDTNAGNASRSSHGHESDAAERLTRQIAEAYMAAPPEPRSIILRGMRLDDSFLEWHRTDPAAAKAWLAALPKSELQTTLTARWTLGAHDRLRFQPDAEAQLDYTTAVLFRQEFDHEHTMYVDSSLFPPELVEAARLQHLENNFPTPAEWESLTSDERRALSAAAIRERAEAPADPFAAPESAGQKKDWLTLFNSLPPEERSLGAYYEAGAAYIKSDEAAASRWLDSLPPGAERDAAATALVEHLVKPGDSQDGEAAFAWAAAMIGETERARYTAEAARAWAAEDPAAARAAVEASALPAAEKAALRQQLPEGGAR